MLDHQGGKQFLSKPTISHCLFLSLSLSISLSLLRKTSERCDKFDKYNTYYKEERKTDERKKGDRRGKRREAKNQVTRARPSLAMSICVSLRGRARS